MQFEMCNSISCAYNRYKSRKRDEELAAAQLTAKKKDGRRGYIKEKG